MNNLVAENLNQIVVDVFQTMLSDEVIPIEMPWRTDPQRLTAEVHFAGPSSGSLLIECSAEDACQVAESLTGVPQTEPGEDVLDGLAEMANMVGGNLKSALHSGSGLSMPSVVRGADYPMQLAGNRPRIRRAFACGPAVFWVTYVSER